MEYSIDVCTAKLEKTYRLAAEILAKNS